MSAGATFTVNDLPTSPTSPRWEEPRRSTAPTRERPIALIGLGESKQPLSQFLRRLTFQICNLVCSNPTIAVVDSLLAEWSISPATENEAPTLHPLVLEWFSESSAVEDCLELEEDRKDLLKLLLAYGVQVNDRAIRPLMYKTLKTGDTEILEWLMDHGQWEINRPVPGHGPPALG